MSVELPVLRRRGCRLELGQVDLWIVGLSLNFLCDDLAADDLAAFLIEREGRLTVELPAVVERVRHSMTKRCIILARKITIGFHRPGLRRVPSTWISAACAHGEYFPRAVSSDCRVALSASRRAAGLGCAKDAKAYPPTCPLLRLYFGPVAVRRGSSVRCKASIGL
jgi:hypothetical protein